MIENDHVVLWNRCLNIIRDNVPDTTYKTWFEPIVPLKYEDHALTIGVPSPFFYEFWKKSSWIYCVQPFIKKSGKVRS